VCEQLEQGGHRHLGQDRGQPVGSAFKRVDGDALQAGGLTERSDQPVRIARRLQQISPSAVSNGTAEP
jgi:hypothetical protein